MTIGLEQVTNTRQYSVKFLKNHQLDVTGTGHDACWSQATALEDFLYPWENGVPDKMSFRALHNKQWFYCLFEVAAHDAIAYRVRDEKPEVLQSDRVEIFFRKDTDMSPYYCLEIDSLSRVYDYEAKFHRIFDPEWSWPKGHLRVQSNRHKDGYSVEVAISKASLQQLGLISGDHILAGIFRAECVSLRGGVADMKWISWIKPSATEPDFHIPSSFGTLVLLPDPD